MLLIEAKLLFAVATFIRIADQLGGRCKFMHLCTWLQRAMKGKLNDSSSRGTLTKFFSNAQLQPSYFSNLLKKSMKGSRIGDSSYLKTFLA